MNRFTSLAVMILCAVISASGSQRALAGSTVFVGSKSSQGVSMDQIDHSKWDMLLKKYVNSDGMVNYQALKSNQSDAAQLDQYLSLLSTASPSVAATRESKLAFWINAYNAVTVKGILREYPTTSIRNHTAKLWGYNIWKNLQLYVGGKPYSLEQIEHEVLRKMGEPRIHFAIVCASIGCPRLLSEAYVTDRLNDQLALNTKDFFSRPQNFRYDQNGQRFYLSSILDWFADDFGADQASRLRKIAGWLPTPGARDAAARNAAGVSYLDYNWQLNRQ